MHCRQVLFGEIFDRFSDDIANLRNAGPLIGRAETLDRIQNLHGLTRLARTLEIRGASDELIRQEAQVGKSANQDITLSLPIVAPVRDPLLLAHIANAKSLFVPRRFGELKDDTKGGLLSDAEYLQRRRHVGQDFVETLLGFQRW